MKKFYFSLLAGMLAGSASYAQFNTNTTTHVTSTTDKVGIGTSNPASLLQIKAIEAYNPMLRLTPLSDNTEASMSFSSYGAENSGSDLWILGNGYGGGQNFAISNTTYNGRIMSWLKNGNVGIATDNPLSLFQVDDGCTKASIGDASGAGMNFGTSYLGFNASRSGSNWLINSDGMNNGSSVIYGDIFGNINFAAIVSTGNQNKTLSDAEVKNKIHFQITPAGVARAKEVKVETTNWPDYVFKPTYRLPSLTQVKSYIDENKHLPNMPSAKEVAKEGVNLGEMIKLQTQKIEELTLYLIQQQEEIKQLKKQIQTLPKKRRSIK
ncbi:hypothetical protein [Mucilaginibacter lacusdianchii]|uniref:hypothetical protein n=1 Tax=Mucilaginibacter lacusdianchii TaxID=2684211 RepID=UPI00131D2645|nr:hypothetical protein [Mucilaginibacter sp. JXJ CY 39]